MAIVDQPNVRVSVIMPFLNAERFIEEAIESVLAQSYTAWELLLVDDGSTDGSTAVARRYAREHPDRVHRLEHPQHENRGASASRNLGLCLARGEYVAFLDSDDVWLPHKLEEQVSLLDATPEAGAIVGAAFWWYSWTGEPEHRDWDFADPPGFPSGTLVSPPQLLAGYLSEQLPVPLPSTMLLRRSAVAAVRGFEEEFRRVYTDQAFFTKLFLVTPTLVSNACWALYRRHGASSVAVARRAGELDQAALAYLTWTRSYLAQRGMQGTAVWRALEARLWRLRHPHLARLRRGVASLPGRLTRSLRRVLPA